jgi:hypothetical protein
MKGRSRPTGQTSEAKVSGLRRLSTEFTKSQQKDKIPAARPVKESDLQTKTARKIRPLRETIPEEFRTLISGTTIDLSGASEFYKNKAAITVLLQEFVEPLDNHHYRLKNGFDDWYLGSLRPYSARNWETPVNTLAEALFQLGIYWARIEYGHVPKNPELYQQFLADPWEGVDEELLEILKSRSLSMPTWRLEVRNDNTLVDANWLEPIQRPLELSLGFAVSLSEPPGMTIQVRGNPASAFMTWWMLVDRLGSERAGHQRKELRKTVTTLFHSILKTVETVLGLRRAGKGRPAKALAERAAYALDHLHKSIRAAARDLCEQKRPGHRCDEQCCDRIRKAAQSYYKQQTSQLRSLMFVNRKQMS